jgi:hypothetical protein
VIKLEHDWYMPVEKTVDVGDSETSLTIDFEKLKVPLKPGKVKPQ